MQKLLDDIYEIVVRDRKEREEIERSGGFFNVFNILGLRTEEVRLHSAFLAELLSPCGCHGMEDGYLKLFLKSVPALEGFKIATSSASVSKEYSIGTISKDGTRGGRIDILITSGSKAVIIENKIYAEDQENQIVRYYNYAQKFSDFRILYLTLDGHLPEDFSAGELQSGHDYHVISYSEDILRWLTACVKSGADRPLASNTIAQYCELIKELTNQMSNELNEKEILRILTCPENVAKTATILDYKDTLTEKFREKYLYSKFKSWAKRKGFDVDEEMGYAIAVRPSDWKNHWITLEVGPVNFDVCIHKTAGRAHKMMPLSMFYKQNDAYPFGWARYTDYFYSLQDIVSGESLKFLIETTEGILAELEDRREELAEKKITL